MKFVITIGILIQFVGIHSLGFKNSLDSGNIKFVQSNVPAEVQEAAAKMVLQRVLGRNNSGIDLKVRFNDNNSSDFFRVTYDEMADIIVFTGTSGVAALFGLKDYLGTYCSCLFVWEGVNCDLSKPLPKVSYQKLIIDRYRYYQNVCTESYSFVWWNWKQWENEIDWMALQGINMPLAFTGQEEIWRRVYIKLGLSDNEVFEYFTGPAFLAWWRMGNIQKWGGPISSSFLSRKLLLLHKILDRMRSLGMTPVLPAFAGNVPKSISRIFPNATLIKHPSWNHFNESYSSTYMLQPTDPTFKRIGKLFMQELISEVGTNHVYSCDTFNENDPTKNSTTFLNDAAQATYEAMAAVDPKAVWMIQSWVFQSPFWEEEQVSAYLGGIEIGNALILDLEAERRPLFGKFKNFYGHKFIWCMLQNYGGTMNTFGSLESVDRGISFARSQVSSDKLIGIGSCPEGINQNSVVFEFLYGATARLGRTNVTEWVDHYSNRRYGIQDDFLHKTWHILKGGPYNAPKEFDNHGKSVIVRRPSLKLIEPIWYDPEDINNALSFFLRALNTTESLSASQLYKFDLVDFTRQFLQILFSLVYKSVVNSFQKGNTEKFEKYSKFMLNILDDLETMLATNERFLLGRWVQAAESWGENSDEEKKLIRYNALNQITLWGPNGEISDYAAKQWSGVVKHYYKPRWELFISTLNTSLSSGKRFSPKRFKKLVLQNVEIPFTQSNREFPTESKGNPVTQASRIHKKWTKLYTRLANKTKRNKKLPHHKQFI